MTGTIFDIKEFALNDGAGIRTTVFLKGCPLRCIWCHNPEGLSSLPELYEKPGCLNCGLCRKGCNHPECQSFGRCLHICPQNLLHITGKKWESKALADKLLAKKDIHTAFGGGITLSGGEPLLQFEFTLDLLKLLKGQVHTAIETSGYADTSVFQQIVKECDFVYMDLKLFEEALHKKHTGVSNKVILQNAAYLQSSGVPHCFRIPLIPGITDTPENLQALAKVTGSSQVELLPYNTLASAKYKSVRRKFTDQIRENLPLNANLSFFQNAILKGK